MTLEEQISGKLKAAIKNRVFPGAVVGMANKNGDRTIVTTGHFTYEAGADPIQENSIFDVASITKSIPTNTIILKLIDEGKIDLNDQLIKYVPEYNNQYRGETLIRHLLTYTVILNLKSPLTSNKDKTPDEILHIICNTELKAKPGTQFLYTNAPSILLGLVAERASGKSLDQLADEMFFKPLGMDKTTFHPDGLDKNTIVPTEQDVWRGRLVHGEVHDETAYSLRKKFVAGNAGLFSTAGDLLTFLEMLLNEGVYKGHTYFSKAVIDLMQTNQLDSIGESASYGWELNQQRFMGQYSSPHTFGKTGFTGCIVVCDIPRQIAFTILSNTVHPKRKPDSSLINKVRSDIADIIFRHNDQ